MGNKAARKRADMVNKWGGAAVVERGRKSIRFQHPTNPAKFAIDSAIGGLHFGPGPFTEAHEIDTAWVDAEGADSPWLKGLYKADYHVLFGEGDDLFSAGQIIKYLEPGGGSEIAFEPQGLAFSNDLDDEDFIGQPADVAPTIDDADLLFVGAYGAGLDFRWQTQTNRLQKLLTIDALATLGTPAQFIIDGGNPVLRLGFIFEKSAGVEIWINGAEWNERANNPQATTGEVEFRDAGGAVLWTFRPGWARDSSVPGPDDPAELRPVTRFRRSGNSLFVEVRVPWAWLQTAVYPVQVDPTIDPDPIIGASDEDAHEKNNDTGFDDTSTVLRQTSHTNSANRFNTGLVFTGLGELSQSDTIDVCNFRQTANHVNTDDANIDIHMEDVATPVDFTATADVNSRTRTTAAVGWSADALGASEVTSPELKTVLQEVVDDFELTDTVCLLLIGLGDATKNYYAISYDQSTTACPDLHVEYTAGGGSPFTLVMAQGSYALTGQALALKAARQLVLAQGAYALAGQAVALKADRQLAAAQGSYALTGQAVGLAFGAMIAADQGSYALTGQALALKAARQLLMAQGAYALAGQDVTLTFTPAAGAFTLVMDQGAYALTGQALALQAGRQLVVAQGSYALTGQALALQAGRQLLMAQGSYALTGQAVTLTFTPASGAFTLVMDQGAYALTGQALALVAGRQLALAQGAYTLTGQTVGLAAQRQLVMAQGAYALTGQALLMVAARMLAAAQGSYALTGQAIALTPSILERVEWNLRARSVQWTLHDRDINLDGSDYFIAGKLKAARVTDWTLHDRE